MTNLKTAFFIELRKASALVKKIYTGKRNISELPTALQHFVLQSGFTELGDIHQTKIEWTQTELKLSKKGPWRSISCIQYNFLTDPIRLVYMKATLFGIFGIEAMDSFRHGRGSMAINAARLFKLVDAKGPEIDSAELVTILAETIIVPDYALQSYIHWEEINSYTVRGTINYHGLKASGIFYFNANFEITRFETDDRYLTDNNGNFKQTKWTATCSAYVSHGGIRFPSLLTSTWNCPTGDFTYFKGQIKKITINP